MTAANKLLNEAAWLLSESDKPLANFLRLKADACLNDNWAPSDVAWLKLDGDIDVTVGPYEVYEDELLNLKAAYECFLCLRDSDASSKLGLFESVLQEMEQALPCEDRFKTP